MTEKCLIKHIITLPSMLLATSKVPLEKRGHEFKFLEEK